MVAEAPSVLAAQRLASAYRNLFGKEGPGRSTDQSLVMADLEYQGFLHRPVHMQRGADDGELTLHRGVFNDGRRSLVLHILGNIARAGEAPKPPKVSRKKKSDPQSP